MLLGTSCPEPEVAFVFTSECPMPLFGRSTTEAIYTALRGAPQSDQKAPAVHIRTQHSKTRPVSVWSHHLDQHLHGHHERHPGLSHLPLGCQPPLPEPQVLTADGKRIFKALHKQKPMKQGAVPTPPTSASWLSSHGLGTPLLTPYGQLLSF